MVDEESEWQLRAALAKADYIMLPERDGISNWSIFILDGLDLSQYCTLDPENLGTCVLLMYLSIYKISKPEGLRLWRKTVTRG